MGDFIILILVALLLIIVAGSAYDSGTQKTINMATVERFKEACKDNGGVYEFNTRLDFTCMNGLKGSLIKEK